MADAAAPAAIGTGWGSTLKTIFTMGAIGTAMTFGLAVQFSCRSSLRARAAQRLRLARRMLRFWDLSGLRFLQVPQVRWV